MKFLYLTLFLLAIASADNWAVLVCGSNGYWNYRHHADIAHAYQIVKKGGIAEDHIITLDEWEELDIDHTAYNGLGGNHKGDHLFSLVKKKVEAGFAEDQRPKEE